MIEKQYCPTTNPHKWKKRILLYQNLSDQEKSEEDLMLTLNKALKKIGKKWHNDFVKENMRYLEKSLLFWMMKQIKNNSSFKNRILLIQAVKSIDTDVIRV